MQYFNEDFYTSVNSNDLVGADPLDVLLLMEAADSDDLDELDALMEALRDSGQQL